MESYRARRKSLADNMDTALCLVVILWVVYFINFLLPGVELREYGVRPRSLSGLSGIVFCPFLHANIRHILANSTACFVLCTLTFTFSRRIAFRVIAVIVLLGGSLVWLFGSGASVHIGASGVIFGLITFLLCMGLFRMELRPLLLSVLVFFLYGGVLFTLLRRVDGVSWSSHFFGAISGVVVAWSTRHSAR